MKLRRKSSVRIVVFPLPRKLISIRRRYKVIQTIVLRMTATQTFAAAKGIKIITLAEGIHVCNCGSQVLVTRWGESPPNNTT